MTLNQPAVHHAHQHDADNIDREQPAVMLRGDAKIANIDIRRTGDKRVSSHVKTGQTEGIAHERAVSHQRGVVAKSAQRRPLLTPRRRQGFRQPAQRNQHQPANRHQQPKNRVPAGEFNQLSADERAGNRRNRHHDSQRRKHLRRAGTGKKIADHRPRQHRPGTGAQGLKYAPENNLIDSGR